MFLRNNENDDKRMWIKNTYKILFLEYISRFIFLEHIFKFWKFFYRMHFQSLKNLKDDSMQVEIDMVQEEEFAYVFFYGKWVRIFLLFFQNRLIWKERL